MGRVRGTSSPEGERIDWDARAGRWGDISSDKEIRPRSTSWSAEMVVRSLVMEARVKSVVGSMGDGEAGSREAEPTEKEKSIFPGCK